MAQIYLYFIEWNQCLILIESNNWIRFIIIKCVKWSFVTYAQWAAVKICCWFHTVPPQKCIWPLYWIEAINGHSPCSDNSPPMIPRRSDSLTGLCDDHLLRQFIVDLLVVPSLDHQNPWISWKHSIENRTIVENNCLLITDWLICWKSFHHYL